MSAIHDAEGALAGLLDSIDDGKLRQVIRLVEASAQRRTLEPALATLRPRLRQLRPRRPLTLRRLLTIPFAAALDREPGRFWSFAISAERLGHWQRLVIERLDPAVTEAARAAIAGRSADDETAIRSAGRGIWPEAARVLAAEPMPGETDSIETERHRVADLLTIADQLVPWLGRLVAPVAMRDDDDRAAVSAILALAQAAPPDRLGVLATVLLRRASQPEAVAPWLVDLAPAVLRPRLHPLLQRLLTEHRAGLARRVADLEADPTLPLDQAIDKLSALADALAGPASPLPERTPDKVQDRASASAEPPGEFKALRLRTAAIARDRYAATIDSVLVPLPASDAANRAAAVKAREEAARRLARLGDTARRLSPDISIHPLTQTTVERLVDLQARRRGRGQALVTVDDARLIEILAGPDLAWRYLRPEPGRLATPLDASGEPPAGC